MTNQMTHVWLLQHVHVMLDEHEDVKVIGIFSSEKEAELAREKLSNLPGFMDSKDGFYIDKYAIDQIGWIEGFVTRR